VDWFVDQTPRVQALVVALAAAILPALIAAATTMTNTGLSNLLSARAARARAKAAERETYRRYADPLGASAASLYWRLKEILEYEAGDYLCATGNLTRYEEFKVRSTHYRIAALLGWIRALRQELFFTLAPPDTTLAPLRESIGTLEHALAEGGEVELARVELLDALWNLNLGSLPKERRQSLGRKIDRILKRHLHQATAKTAQGLGDNAAKKLVEEVAAEVSSATHRELPGDVVAETRHQALRALAVRESWIYRDWQAGIADMMLEPSMGTIRKFTVIGYGQFEQYCLAADPNQMRWLTRLSDLLEGLEFPGDERADARIGQMRSVHLAVAKMIACLHAADLESGIVTEATLEAVRATSSWGSDSC
jgi:hypothetical protein